MLTVGVSGGVTVTDGVIDDESEIVAVGVLGGVTVELPVCEVVNDAEVERESETDGLTLSLAVGEADSESVAVPVGVGGGVIVGDGDALLERVELKLGEDVRDWVPLAVSDLLKVAVRVGSVVAVADAESDAVADALPD